ncbi:MAG: hypothetical protein AB8C84_10660 [Oligoflexales bacterium]
MLGQWIWCFCLVVVGCGASEDGAQAPEGRAGREFTAGSYSLQDRAPDVSADGKRVIFLSAQSGKVQVHAMESEFGVQGTLKQLTTVDIGQPILASLEPAGRSAVVWSWKDTKLTLLNVSWEGEVHTLGSDDSKTLRPISEGIAFSTTVPDLFAYTVGVISESGAEKVYVQYRNGTGLGRYVGEGRVVGWVGGTLWIQKHDTLFSSEGWVGDGLSNFNSLTDLSLVTGTSGHLKNPYPSYIGDDVLSMKRAAAYDVYPLTSTEPMSFQSRMHWLTGNEDVAWQSQVPGHHMLTWSGSRAESFGVGVTEVHYVCPDRKDEYGRAIVSFSPTVSQAILPKSDLSGAVTSPCEDENIDVSVVQIVLMSQATSQKYRAVWATLQDGESKVRMLEVQNGQQTFYNLSAESLSLHGL